MVNGEDLSSASHQRILTVFNTASEPILVEVARRTHPLTTVFSPTHNQSSHMADLSVSIPNSSKDEINPYATTLISHANYDNSQASVGLDYYGPNEQTIGLSPSPIFQPKTIPLVNIAHNCAELLKIDGIMEEDEEDDDEQAEVIKEEVTLRKVHPREIFGLTLSYSALAANDHAESEVYISAIELDSVASKQQGIRIGDQILQINGIDVHSKAQVVSLFQSCGLEVCLLLGRPAILPKKPDFPKKNGLFNCDLPPLEEAEYSCVYDEVESCKEKNKYKGNLDKDSGIGRGTDETTKTEESSECDSSQTSLRKSSQFSSLDSSQGLVDLQQISQLMQHLAVEYHQLQRLLQGPSEFPRIQALPPPTLNQPSSRVVPRMGTKMEAPQLKLSSPWPPASGSNTSAYSTGVDSTRSSPLTMELAPTINSTSMLSLKLDNFTNCRSKNYCDENYHMSSSSRTKLNSYTSSDKKSVSSSSATDLVDPRMAISSIVTSTNISENECHYYDVYDPSTINQSNTYYDPDVFNQPSNIYVEHEYVNSAFIKSDRNNNKMEWVVKKRPDGTRYITRRPIRNKVPKDRGKKVFEERSGLITEEEENSFESKMNKYLGKLDKKKYQDKSKEKKHKRKESTSPLQSDPSTSSPALSRSDFQYINRLTLKDIEHKNVDYDKLYNRPTFIVGTTMF